MQETYDKIKSLVANAGVEIEKFRSGNKTAAVRARKAMLEVNKLTKQLRNEIQEHKNA